MTAVCIEQHHLSLVRSTAWRLTRHYLLPISIIDDLIGEGMLGLVEARRDYDPEREAAFPTYATYRAKGRMLDLIRRECRHLIVPELTDHLHTQQPVEDAVIARETLSTLGRVVRNLPHRRRKILESAMNLQPIQRAAAEVFVPERKAQRWRRQVLAEVAALAA